MPDFESGEEGALPSSATNIPRWRDPYSTKENLVGIAYIGIILIYSTIIYITYHSSVNLLDAQMVVRRLGAWDFRFGGVSKFFRSYT